MKHNKTQWNSMKHNETQGNTIKHKIQQNNKDIWRRGNTPTCEEEKKLHWVFLTFLLICLHLFLILVTCSKFDSISFVSAHLFFLSWFLLHSIQLPSHLCNYNWITRDNRKTLLDWEISHRVRDWTKKKHPYHDFDVAVCLRQGWY